MSRGYEQHGRRHGPKGSDPIPGGSGGPRISYGNIYGDGEAAEAGSGDWESTSGSGDSADVIEITFDPPFATQPQVFVTPSYGVYDMFADGQPDFQTYGGYVSALPLVSVSDDFSRVYVAWYDPDGNPNELWNSFDFEVVGT